MEVLLLDYTCRILLRFTTFFTENSDFIILVSQFKIISPLLFLVTHEMSQLLKSPKFYVLQLTVYLAQLSPPPAPPPSPSATFSLGTSKNFSFRFEFYSVNFQAFKIFIRGGNISENYISNCKLFENLEILIAKEFNI